MGTRLNTKQPSFSTNEMQNQNQSQLEQVTGNYYSDWFIPLFAPIVIGRSNDFGIGFTTVIWTRL